MTASCWRSLAPVHEEPNECENEDEITTTSLSQQVDQKSPVRCTLPPPPSNDDSSKECFYLTGNREQQQQEQLTHSYRAIKLTNYFTNLLNQQQQLKNKGDTWRKEQLEQQLPQQDIKLLGLESEEVTQSNDAHDEHDEIKFIKSQQKMASQQFKASLYYLNPTRSTTSSTLNALKETTTNNHNCFQVSKFAKKKNSHLCAGDELADDPKSKVSARIY